MNVIETGFKGLRIIEPFCAVDERGVFVKNFSTAGYREIDESFTVQESYYSFSEKNVIRGMHFQLPPDDHAKIVYCSKGAIDDVVIDLRKISSTYGKVFSISLSADNQRQIYIPKGFAHGFKAVNESIVHYLVSSEYQGKSDTGILWDSIPYDWKVINPVISTRDLTFKEFSNFNSPF